VAALCQDRRLASIAISSAIWRPAPFPRRSAISTPAPTHGSGALQSGQAGSGMMEAIGLFRHGAAIGAARRVDRPRRQGRIAQVRSDAADRHRTQHRRHGMELEYAKAYVHDGIPPTSASDGQRQGPDLRFDGSQHRAASLGRSHQTTNRACSRRNIAIRKTPTTKSTPNLAPSPYWGERADLGHAYQRPQSDVRRKGTAVADGAHSPQPHSRLLQSGFRAPSAMVYRRIPPPSGRSL